MSGQAGPELSSEQHECLTAVERFIAEGPGGRPTFEVDGLAGTGKTTVLARVARQYPDTWLSALTGKACDVLRRKTGRGTATIHSTFYNLKDKRRNAEGKELLEWRTQHDAEDLYGRVILLDEHSMIDTNIARDILRTGARIVAFGDPGQLKPVAGEQYFTKPDFTLKKIHRQALDSPIIRQAHWVRLGRGYSPDGEAFQVVPRVCREDVLRADVILCWRNTTRHAVNALMRRYRGIVSPNPQPGEPVLCLRNAADFNVFNGGVYPLTREFYDGGSTIWLDINGRETEIPNVCFENLQNAVSAWEDVTTTFSFGYGLTVHKFQGSEAPCGILIDEYSREDDRIPWLYTGITRFSQRVTVVRR